MASQGEDPTTSTWTIPERLNLLNTDTPSQPSLAIFAGQTLLAVQNQNEITIFEMDVGTSTEVEELSLNNAQYASPQLVAYQEMLHLLTVSSSEEGWQIWIHRATSLNGWIDAELAMYGTGQVPASPSLAITSDGTWHLAWTTTDHQGSFIQYSKRVAGEWTEAEDLAGLSHNNFIFHKDVALYALDNLLYASWVSNMFDDYSFPGERNERELVFSVFDEDSWSEPQPIWASYAVDKHPSFIQGANTPTVIFSSNRVYEKQHESELDNFHDIWIQVLGGESQPHELPEWPINEGQPTAVILKDTIYAIWADENGLIWSQSSLNEQTINEAEKSVHISISPQRIDKALNEGNSVGEISVRNDGQSSLRGKITPSKQLSVSIDSFDLLAGQELNFWVNFNQDISGEWHESLIIDYQGGSTTIPVHITRQGMDQTKTAPMPKSVQITPEIFEESDDMGMLVFISALLIPLLVGGVLHSSNGGNPLALRMGLMVSIMLASPFGAMIAQGAEESPKVIVDNYDVQFAEEPKIDIDWFNESAEEYNMILSEGRPISASTYEVEGVRTLLRTSHAVKELDFKIAHGGTQDVRLRIKDMKTDSIEWHQLVDGQSMRTIQYTEAQDISFDATHSLLDNQLGGEFELIIINHRAPGGDTLPNSRIDYPVRQSEVNTSHSIHPWKNIPLSHLDLKGSKLIFDLKTNSLIVRGDNANDRALNDKDWQVGMENGTLAQLEMTVSIVSPLIRSVSVAGPSGSKTQRFFSDTQNITIEVSLFNEVLKENPALTSPMVTGRLEVRAVDISTNTSYGLIHCQDSVTATNSWNNVSVVIPIGMDDSTGCSGQESRPGLLEDRSYFLIVDYILADGKSHSRFGADPEGNILTYQIPPTAFTVTFGNVVKSVNLLHESIHSQDEDEDKPIYVITASDAKSTMSLDQEEIIESISQSQVNPVEIIRINSTEDFQALVEGGEQSITVVNLHGDVLPIPMSYIDGISPPTSYLGKWNFDGKGAATTAPDSSLYRNDGNITGSPEYLPIASIGTSSLSLDGVDDSINISSSAAVIIHDGGEYCIALRGPDAYQEGERHACFAKKSEAITHLPRGLFDLQEMQLSINLRIKQPTGQNNRLIAAYGEEESESWKITLDSNGYISAHIATNSGVKVLESNSSIPVDEWFNVDLLINDEFELHVNNELQSSIKKEPINYYQDSHNLFIGGGLSGYNNTAMLIDGMFIADQIIEVDGIKTPTSEDQIATHNWIDRLGRWIAEDDITYLSLGNEPMSMVSNDKSLWKGKVMLLEESGLTTLLEDYSVPRDGLKGSFEGTIGWMGEFTTHVSPSADWVIGSLEPKGSLDGNQVSETLAGSGTASVVERFMIGSGSIVQTSLDLEDPYTFIEAIDFVVELATGLQTYDSEPIYVIAAMDAKPCKNTPATCDASEIIKVLRDYESYHIVEINSTSNLKQFIDSGVTNALMLNMHGDHIPIDNSYITGAKPNKFSEGLFDFESNQIATLTLQDQLYLDPSSNSVKISLVKKSNSEEIESFEWDSTIDLNDPIIVSEHPNLWLPWQGSVTQTGVNLSEIININSQHLKATSAANLVTLKLESGKFSPHEVEVISSKVEAISVLDISNSPRPVDKTVHRMGSTTNEPSWTNDTILGKSAITLSTNDYFSLSGYSPRLSDQTIDFWIKVEQRPAATYPVLAWYSGAGETLSQNSNFASIELSSGSSNDDIDIGIGTNKGTIKIGEWSAITLQLPAGAGNDLSLYINRDSTPVSTTGNPSSLSSLNNKNVELRFLGSADVINIDQIHVGKHQQISDIAANDIDLAQAYEDLGFFFGQSKNTIVSNNVDPFGYASIPSSFNSYNPYLSVDAHQSWTIPICIDGDLAYQTQGNECAGGNIIHSLPDSVTNTIPICVATDGVKSLMMKNRDSCDHGAGIWSTDFVFNVRDSPMNNGNQMHTIPDKKWCIRNNLDSTLDTITSLVVLDLSSCSSSDITFHASAEQRLLSGYNLMYPQDLAPLFVSSEMSGYSKSNVDFSNILTLGEDIASFTYEQNESLDSTEMANNLDFINFVNPMPGVDKTLVSPTGDDWMYSLANYQTPDEGAIIHTAMFSVRGGMFVLAPEESHEAKAVMGQWAKLRAHRTMHVISEQPPLDDTISEYAKEAVEDGYLMINHPQTSTGLFDAIDGIYMHGADSKIIALTDPSTLPVPKSWMEGVDQGEGTRVQVSSDVTYTGTETPTAGLQFSTYELSTCEASTINIEFSMPQSDYELKGFFTDPILAPMSNTEGLVDDVSADIFYDSAPTCSGSTTPWWATANELTGLGNSGLSDSDAVGQIHTLSMNLPANSLTTQWYIAIEAKLSHTPYFFDIHRITQTIGTSTTDITELVLGQQIHAAFDNSNKKADMPNDYLQGFVDTSIEFSSLHQGFQATEAVTKFGEWIAHHSHALTLVQSGTNTNSAFSKLLESDGNGGWITYDLGDDGWDKFAQDQLSGMRRNLVTSDGNWNTAPAFKNELVTKTHPRENGTYWTLDSANQHTHPLLWASNETSPEQDPVRALAMISNGMLLNIGDGDWQSAMDLAVKFVYDTSAIRHMAHVYAKGETVVMELVIDTSIATNDLHGKFIMEVKAHGAQADSFSVADSTTMIIGPNSITKIHLSWTIDSSQHIGGYDIGLAVIDTVLNRYITDFGNQRGQKMSIEVQSLVYITKVISPKSTGAFDEVEVEVHLYNPMSVSNIVDLKTIFVHEESGHIHWTNDVTLNCQARRRCFGRTSWNPVAQTYEGEVTELGEYSGRVILQDHVSRYQVASIDDSGGAVYQQSNAIIDVSDLLLTLEAELQITTPVGGGDWLVRFSLNGPWTLLKEGSILRETNMGRELQLKKLDASSTDTDISDLTITWIATSDSPSFIMYSTRTSDADRSEYASNSVWNFRHHVDKFHRDGRTYPIKTNGMLQNSIITIADSPDINMGTLSNTNPSSSAPALFDEDKRSVSYDALEKGKSAFSEGYTTVLDIDVAGFYQFAGLSTSDAYHIYTGVFNYSAWNPKYDGDDSIAIDRFTDPDEVAFFGPSTGNTSNYFLDIGTWVLFIGNTNVASDGGDPPTTADSMPTLDEIHFRRGNRVDLVPTPACPGAGYSKIAKEQGEKRVKAQGGTCGEHTEGSGGAQKSRSAGDVGLIHRLVPKSILSALTSNVKIPLIGANSNGGKANFSHNFGKYGVAKATLGFDDKPFESDFRLEIEFGGKLELEGTGIEIDFSMQADVIMQEQFFRKHCYKDVIIWDCSLPSDIGDYIGWYVRFDVSIQIPIGEYIWGAPIDMEVSKSSSSGSVYYTLKLDLYLDVMIGVQLYNNVYACDPASKFQEKYPAAYSSIMCNPDGTSPNPQWVSLDLELTFGARLLFKFYMEFEFKKIHNKLKNIREKMDAANKYAEDKRQQLIGKIQEYEEKATKYVEEKYNSTKNKLTRSQLMSKFQKLSGKHWGAVQAMAIKADEKFKDASHSKKISGEAERWLKALGPAAKANSFIPNGYVSVDFAIGIYLHFDLECADIGHGIPCKVLLSIEVFLSFEATAHIELFRICIWLLGCWTPTIDIGLELNIDKVVYINIFGGPPGWDQDQPWYGQVMFNDRSTGFKCFHSSSADVTAMATDWQPGEGLDAKSGSMIKINALGFIHINIGIPSIGC